MSQFLTRPLRRNVVQFLNRNHGKGWYYERTSGYWRNPDGRHVARVGSGNEYEEGFDTRITRYCMYSTSGVPQWIYP